MLIHSYSDSLIQQNKSNTQGLTPVAQLDPPLCTQLHTSVHAYFLCAVSGNNAPGHTVGSPGVQKLLDPQTVCHSLNLPSAAMSLLKSFKSDLNVLHNLRQSVWQRRNDITSSVKHLQQFKSYEKHKHSFKDSTYHYDLNLVYYRYQHMGQVWLQKVHGYIQKIHGRHFLRWFESCETDLHCRL